MQYCCDTEFPEHLSPAENFTAARKIPEYLSFSCKENFCWRDTKHVTGDMYNPDRQKSKGKYTFSECVRDTKRFFEIYNMHRRTNQLLLVSDTTAATFSHYERDNLSLWQHVEVIRIRYKVSHRFHVRLLAVKGLIHTVCFFPKYDCDLSCRNKWILQNSMEEFTLCDCNNITNFYCSRKWYSVNGP